MSPAQEPQKPGDRSGRQSDLPTKKAAPVLGETPQAAADAAVRPKAPGGQETAIPWGYGVDRVGAMAVDPERLFVYWEVTDDAIERAREQAGSVDDEAPLVLRVYDVTGRIFDGTNAHHSFDQEISRSDRRWFFDIGKPESAAIVELGLRLEGDRFVRIARSRRVEFPRAEIPQPSAPRWLTVHVRDGRPEPSPVPRQHSPRESPPTPETDGSAAVEPGPTEQHDGAWTDGVPDAPESDARTLTTAEVESRATGSERTVPIERESEERRFLRWEKPESWAAWESGPLTTDLEVPAPWTESRLGETRFWTDGSGARFVTEPWEVVIRGLGAYRRREVLAQWEIHRTWICEEGNEVTRIWSGNATRMPGSSETIRPGASERRWMVGSELRLSGSSERLFMGASERRLGGASERILRGASERLLRGASERLLRGASERRLGGASERRLGGASEQKPRGASERRLGGASERRPRGAGEPLPVPSGKRTYPDAEGEPGGE